MDVMSGRGKLGDRDLVADFYGLGERAEYRTERTEADRADSRADSRADVADRQTERTRRNTRLGGLEQTVGRTVGRTWRTGGRSGLGGIQDWAD